ncbi:MAG TPA: glycosyltransferase family 4 protein [Blastocatellia bacterium]|nr:glycosyltransferase family 4 protein [Blastocatellia bacterium]
MKIAATPPKPPIPQLTHPKRDLALLLNLSGDEDAARRWAEGRFAGLEVRAINKADLKWGSKREALQRIREMRPLAFAIFSSDLETQSARGAMMAFGALTGARRILMGDRAGRTLTRSRAGALLIEAPRFMLEWAVGNGLLLPLSWLLTLALGSLLHLRKVARHAGAQNPQSAIRNPQSLAALHIRATLTNFAEGGMPTHVEGFTRGAHALGHRLVFLASGKEGAKPAGGTGAPLRLIKPSAMFSASRAQFELWNNLVFTAKALLRLLTDAQARREIDFIYQRYSRFNWTGAALSLATGLPMALEYNGSEVWISRAWDPVGHLWLLKRFERLNLRAADFIFTVSEVERRNLIRAGVSAEKVITNPNGVDPDEFRPGCGGQGVRRELGIEEEKLVVGFLGTFGPWHGAESLAKAATKLNQPSRFHFLFIGDGDQRPIAEAIIASADRKAAATFTGRVPHHRAPAYLDACDILASPHVPMKDGSEFFGSPTKLFEYLAMARPVVASRLGQIGDVIADGENGLLIEPGDADALARAIERLADDQELRAKLGNAARQTVIAHYTWRHNAARVFDAMRNLK